MKKLLESAIRNTPAMNTLMVAVLAIGAFSLFSLRREVFPEFDLEIILVTVPYPGASPEEVEEGICQKIEEAVRSVQGIKKQTAVAKEGVGSLVLELHTYADPQRVLNEVRSEVDHISSFPLLAEDPEVKQITLRQPAIHVGVIGPESNDSQAEWRLREVTEQVRDDLIRLPAVSQANIVGAKEYQIDVEIAEETLRRYGLSLQEVARIIREENVELPGGTLRGAAQDVLIRGKNKGTIGREIERIPLLTRPDGVVLTVGDLGEVRDEFVDIEAFTRINGRPGMAISVDRASNEDLLAMTDAVNAYVASKQMPPGYELVTWADRSVEVRDRLHLLSVNGLQGLILVVILLAMFMDLRLSFWVAVGIPISILGACAVLYFGGHTMNMLSSFTFVMALGIVVDDAIVVSENIYAHRQMGKSPLRAAIDGAMEVAPSVASSVATTIIAFVPLFFVSGVMGKFIAVMPWAMIAVLLFSLFEATFVLPCHLAHEGGRSWQAQRIARGLLARRGPLTRLLLAPVLLPPALLIDGFLRPLEWLSSGVAWLSRHCNRGLDYIGERLYTPVMKVAVANPVSVLCIGVTMLLLTLGLKTSGIVPFSIFPKMDSNTIEANIRFPDGTPASVADAATQRLEATIRDLAAQWERQGTPVLRLTRRSVGLITKEHGPGATEHQLGGHLGAVTAELLDTSQRTIDSTQILNAWRTAAGEFPGAESVTFSSGGHGPGGVPIEFKLLSTPEYFAALEQAVEETKARLRSMPGVFDIADDSRPGKWEFQLKVKEDAMAMGVTLSQLAETVRAAYYGEEVMRLQRGRHEVKLMVRYPETARRSLADFEQLRVRTGDGAERPITELADVRVARGYAEINRVNQLRSITISADVDENVANTREIVAGLQREFMPELLARYPGIHVRWEGQQEQTDESIRSLSVGLSIALIAMFALLTLEFNSYLQPLIIMAIIPFGVVGAVLGHALMGLPITLFSLFGLVTLTGIVVNDSIVLVDFINAEVRSGTPVLEALVTSGRRRLRPIFLTSITTIAGLSPLMMERSFQAQVLVPMAVTICFGLAASTVLCLFLVPTFYLVHFRATETLSRLMATGKEAAEPVAVSESAAAHAGRNGDAPVSDGQRSPIPARPKPAASDLVGS